MLKRAMSILLIFAILTSAAPAMPLRAHAQVPGFAQQLRNINTGSSGDEPAATRPLDRRIKDVSGGQVLTREEIIAHYGEFSFEDLINVRSVAPGQEPGSYYVVFENEVYYGGTEGYVQDWFAADGIISEVFADFDADGAQEYLILWVDSYEVREYDYSYINNEWCISIFEPVEGGYCIADSFYLYLSGSGERFLRIVEGSQGTRILYGSINYWDGGGGIYAVTYGYDGSAFFIDMVANASTDLGAYLYVGRREPEFRHELIELASIYDYDTPEVAYVMEQEQIVMNQNLFFPNENLEWDEIYDYETGRLNTQNLASFAWFGEVVAQFGADLGCRITDDSYDLYLEGGSDLFYAKEGFHTSGDVYIKLIFRRDEMQAQAPDWNRPFATIVSTGSGDMNRGTVFPQAYLDKVVRVEDEVGGWFRMIAPADGDYVFSVLAPDLEYPEFSMEICLDQQRYQSLGFVRSDIVQTGVVTGIKQGQLLTWWNNDGTGRWYTLQSPFRMCLSIVPTQPEPQDVVQLLVIGDKNFGYDEAVEVEWISKLESPFTHGEICVRDESGTLLYGCEYIPSNRIRNSSADLSRSVPSKNTQVSVQISIYNGETVIATDEMLIDVERDADMHYLDTLDRDALELWLDNETPRENWEEYRKSGFLLLEEMLDENGGWWMEAAYQVYKFGMDVLGLNALGLVLDVLELADDDKEIQALMIENYALYLSCVAADLETMQTNDTLTAQLYQNYKLLCDNYDLACDAVRNIDRGASALKEVLDNYGYRGRGMSYAEFASLHVRTKYRIGEGIEELWKWLEDNDQARLWKQANEIDRRNIEQIRKNFAAEWDALEAVDDKLGKRLEIGGAAANAGLLAMQIYEYGKAKGIAVEEYAQYIDVIALCCEDYFLILDDYISAAEGNTKDALVDFRDSLYEITTQQGAEVIQKIAKAQTNDKAAGAVSTGVDVVMDLIGIFCENKGIKFPAWATKIGSFTNSVSTNPIAVVASLVFSVHTSVARFDDKEAVYKNLLYYRSLKAALADAILAQFDSYRGGMRTPEQAAKIISALHFMKQLKYSGEYAALELCALLTKVSQYPDYTPRWRIAVKWADKWMISHMYYDVRSEKTQEYIEMFRGHGYEVRCVKAAVTPNMVPAFNFDPQTGEFVPPDQIMFSSSGKMLGDIAGFRPSMFIGADALYLPEDAIAQTQLEISAMLAAIDRQDPENYEWWVDYVENNTIDRIESLQMP